MQLLLALHYMRTKHVLHRDLKTSNIFLTAENDVQVGVRGVYDVCEVTLKMLYVACKPVCMFE